MTKDPRAIGSLSLAQLQRRLPAYAHALAWLHAVRLLPEATLRELLWPGAPARRQEYGLARMAGAHLIERATCAGIPLAQLGRRGARVLSQSGHPAIYRRLPGAAAAPGIVRGATFVAGLAAWLAEAGGCRALTWSARPFAGEIVRPDGLGAVVWGAGPLAALPWRVTPRPGDALTHLALEVDDGTEIERQLERRAAHWRAGLALRERSRLPPADRLRVLWVTSGGWERAWQIVRCWLDAGPRCPACCATTASLGWADPAAPPDLAAGLWLGEGGVLHGTGGVVRPPQ